MPKTIKINMRKTIKIPKLKKDEFLIVKVGSDERPATSKDIEDVNNCLKQSFLHKNKKTRCNLTTHHLVDFFVVNKKAIQKAIICSHMMKTSDLKEIMMSLTKDEIKDKIKNKIIRNIGPASFIEI